MGVGADPGRHVPGRVGSKWSADRDGESSGSGCGSGSAGCSVGGGWFGGVVDVRGGAEPDVDVHGSRGSAVEARRHYYRDTTATYVDGTKRDEADQRVDHR